ncbi:hypothetical protein CZ794_09415 [Psychrobacter sp. JB385]|nr:hypothetical protein CZ794_09415 [Psychrobacter sp. JB385]
MKIRLSNITTSPLLSEICYNMRNFDLLFEQVVHQLILLLY